MDFSPIVLFAYNRPLHTERTLSALAKNPEAKNSDLFIFCDGPKKNASSSDLEKISEVYKIAKKENRFKKIELRTSAQNKGLAKSIIEGVTEVIGKYDKIIVLEDDIETSPGFLKYMNDALHFYQKEEKVMHISGYMFPNNEDLPETFFFKVPLCWGWATWGRAWKHFFNDPVFLWNELKRKNQFKELDKFGGNYLSSQLAHNITGKMHTWFIKWHASVTLQNGLTLFPRKSLVENTGFDRSGVHNGEHKEFTIGKLLNEVTISPIELEESKHAGDVIKKFYESLKKPSKKVGLKHIIKKNVRKLVFLFFPDLKKVLKYNQQILQSKTYLGDNSKVYAPARLTNSVIGDFTYISGSSVINNTTIGKFCSIGTNFMAGRGIHPTNGISTHPMFYSTAKQNGLSLCATNKINEFKPIVIGNDVFIGMNVTVLDGVTIGDGAIIGAGAVVSKNIPPYAIAVGNPIQILRYRFNPDTIANLIKLEWWNLDRDNLSLVEKYFFEVEEFIKVLAKQQNESQVER